MNARPLVSHSILSLLLVAGLAQSAHAAPPPAPSGCFAVAYNPTATTATVRVNWNDNSTNEIQWKIQVSVNNGPFVDLGTIASGTTATTGSQPEILWQTAPLNSTLRFKVLALTSTEVSAPSNIATVGSYPLNSPINLNVTAVDPFNVSLTWEEGSTSEAGVALEMKVGTGPWVYLGTLDPNTVAFGPYHLVEPAGSYLFRARVYQGGEPSTPGSGAGASAVSDYSNEAPVTTGDYPLTATAAPGQPTINLSWPNILNEAGYQLMIRRPGDPSYLQLDLLAANTTTYQVSSPILDPGKT